MVRNKKLEAGNQRLDKLVKNIFGKLWSNCITTVITSAFEMPENKLK